MIANQITDEQINKLNKGIEAALKLATRLGVEILTHLGEKSEDENGFEVILGRHSTICKQPLYKVSFRWTEKKEWHVVALSHFLDIKACNEILGMTPTSSVEYTGRYSASAAQE